MAYNKDSKDGGSFKRRPMHRRKKVCVFCGKDNVIDYKDTNKLKRYISERGKILPKTKKEEKIKTKSIKKGKKNKK